MKKLLIEDISNKETIGLMVAIGLIGIFLKNFGLL
jgi:hypothetical protein|tara:strand:- start:191 stop:295 length:105 start_codon:yes stop_codon:yes gene_type:complete